MPEDESIPTERVAKMMWFLMRGHRYSTLDASIMIGLQVRGTRDMLNKISRVVPLTSPKESEDRLWGIKTDTEDN